MTALQHGDYTTLAGDYSDYRPAYSETVLSATLATLDKPPEQLDCVDVGAGTGIWTRMLANRHPRSLRAVEPNDAMREQGRRDSAGYAIDWLRGSGENTGLEPQSVDLLTMASSFHWVDFPRGTAEFARLLRPGGRFAALWNPRYLETNPLLLEIEQHLQQLVPTLKRRSSGRSGLTSTLTEQLWNSPWFDDVLSIEARHTQCFTPQQYLGAWRSVNDVRVQAGPQCFEQFLAYIDDRTRGMAHIEAEYLTRAWVARRVAGS